jgi:hypothetical protein
MWAADGDKLNGEPFDIIFNHAASLLYDARRGSAMRRRIDTRKARRIFGGGRGRFGRSGKLRTSLDGLKPTGLFGVFDTAGVRAIC